MRGFLFASVMTPVDLQAGDSMSECGSEASSPASARMHAVGESVAFTPPATVLSSLPGYVKSAWLRRATQTPVTEPLEAERVYAVMCEPRVAMPKSDAAKRSTWTGPLRAPGMRNGSLCRPDKVGKDSVARAASTASCRALLMCLRSSDGVGAAVMVTDRASRSTMKDGGQGSLAMVSGRMKPWGLGSSGERKKR